MRASRTASARSSDVEAGVLVDLLLSYRAVAAWGDMVALVGQMPAPLAGTVSCKSSSASRSTAPATARRAERPARADRAARPEQRNLGILGRVYKDRWDAAALERRQHSRAACSRRRSTRTSRLRGRLAGRLSRRQRGDADGDADPPDPRREGLLPVVGYAVERRIASGTADYWDHATRLELAVLGRDEEAGMDALDYALAVVREPWEPETTAGNLAMIREARASRGESVAWADEAEKFLRERAVQQAAR